MIELNDVLAEIDEAPEGPSTAAFFDFDGTIIDGYSALAALGDRARHFDIAPAEVVRLVLAGVGAATGDGGFPDVMREAVRELAGERQGDLDELGARLLKGRLGGALYPEAWRLVAAHRQRGHTVVIASSALPFQVEPLAAEMGIDHVLCTRLAQSDGVMTGEVDGPILWGSGKADAVRVFAAEADLALGECFGYANGNEDIDFLSVVGRPRPVNPGSTLTQAAEERGWPTMRFEPRARPGLANVVRTVAAYGAMASAFGAGLGIGLVNRSRRDALNLTISMGSEAALGLAGIKVKVWGPEHLWEQRPAVFIFNHQSRLDGLIVMKLLRSDVTGVAKKESAKQPGFAPLAWLANMAVIDGQDTTRPADAMAPVVERLAQGYSIAVSPEETRSSTPKVGTFEKGAFHMAMQGGVPIVPIVIRNAGELLWRGSTFMRSGTLDVAVLAPISVDRCGVAGLGARVAETRELFVRTLAAWPS